MRWWATGPAAKFAERSQSRQTGDMEFDGTRRELYCVMPKEFTAARDAKVSEARGQGNSGLANSLKGLRKPSVGAWLANLLVRGTSS